MTASCITKNNKLKKDFSENICSLWLFVIILQPIYAEGAQKSESTNDFASRSNPLNNIKMYAIVEINGQQFKAEAGKKLFVQHIQSAEAGQAVEFEKVLLVDNDGNITVGAPTVDGAKVTAEVVSPLVKGEKVLVFHKKRRKGYRKLNGHRQQFTELTVKEVIA